QLGSLNPAGRSGDDKDGCRHNDGAVFPGVNPDDRAEVDARPGSSEGSSVKDDPRNVWSHAAWPALRVCRAAYRSSLRAVSVATHSSAWRTCAALASPASVCQRCITSARLSRASPAPAAAATYADTDRARPAATAASAASISASGKVNVIFRVVIPSSYPR